MCLEAKFTNVCLGGLSKLHICDTLLDATCTENVNINRLLLCFVRIIQAFIHFCIGGWRQTNESLRFMQLLHL